MCLLTGRRRGIDCIRELECMQAKVNTSKQGFGEEMKEGEKEEILTATTTLDGFLIRK